MRGKSGRKPVKQPGSPGAALAQVAEPDLRVKHFPRACGGCSSPLEVSKRAGEPVRRQVFDVPEMKVFVTEHVMHALICGCGAVTRADAPAGATAPAVYGPNATALRLGARQVDDEVPEHAVTAQGVDLVGSESRGVV
jgi:transposase